MTDLYANSVTSMADYIISRLNGSAASFSAFKSYDIPSNFIIIGSLANRITNEIEMGSSSTKSRDISMMLKFKTDVVEQFKANLHYSIFKEEPCASLKPNEHFWKRIDYQQEFSFNGSGNKTLQFGNETGYAACVEYSIEKQEEDYLITISVTNNSVSDKKDRYLFDVWFDIKIDNGGLLPFVYEYYYEGRKRILKHNFRTVNCAANYDPLSKTIITSSCPKFEMYKKKLKDSDDGISLDFNKLSNDPIPVLNQYSDILKQYLDLYIRSEHIHDSEYDENLKKYQTICEKFNEGVKLLSSNANAESAFKMMNEVFSKSSKHNQWRAFQLTYIVCSIPGIISKNNHNECDVIHIPTGGGKTEAYLGLVIFSIFYERIIGHIMGTTAIVKFPLRMLSVQQMERVVQKVVIAEEVRKEHNIEGDPFTLGFYVGNSTEFPNKTFEEMNAIKEKEKQFGPNSVPGKLIKECPLCGGKVVLRNDLSKNCILHKCTSCSKIFHLFYTDEEVYRFLPTVIISTVDKLSTVSSNRYARIIFGAQIRICKCHHGYVPAGEKCNATLSNSKSCDSFYDDTCDVDMSLVSSPLMVIQDELHLIRESFGTIDSHFESFCDNLEYSFTHHKPKHIAMTATITGCQDQIKQLYCLNANVFPGYDPHSLVDSGLNPFYYDEKDENGLKLHRLLIGLKPNTRDNQFALNLTMRYAIEFVEDLKAGKIDLNLGRIPTSDELESVVKSFTKYLTYHLKKGDVRSTKQYIRTVAGDDGEIKAELKALTGDNTMDEIRDVLTSIDCFNSSDTQEIHITSATSIVSHGIDIEDWNFMEFQGIPGKTAEYIQAMSRVGRKHCGLIFVWFYPTRVRDLSFYHNFAEYHKILDDLVEPVSINRWTRLGFMETCTSIMCATILNYTSALRKTSIYKQSDVVEYLNNSEWRGKLIQFMNSVYHTEEKTEGAEEIREMIDSEVGARLNIIFNSPADPNKNFFPNMLKQCSDRYYGLQIGMRGIQDSIVMKPDLNSKIYTEEDKNGQSD